MWTSETQNVGLKIPDFLKKIEEKKVVLSPKFNFSGDTDGVDFELKVKAGSENPQFISVFLFASKEDQITSVTFLEGSGARASWEMAKVLLPGGWGYKKFLSLVKFKTWAKTHGDVFMLRATVTLHQKKQPGECWIRYCVFLLLCLGVNISVQEQAKSGGAEVSEKRGHHPYPHQGHHDGRGHRGFHRPLCYQGVQGS